MLAPYYESDDGGISVYHAPWEDVIAAKLVPLRRVKLIHGDPPYGVDYDPARGTTRGGFPKGRGKRDHGFKRVPGDDKPFEPAPLLSLDRPLVLWGAIHYADKLPVSPSWIMWDKREDVMPPDDHADGEMAWSNLGGPLRIFRLYWRGALRRREKEVRHIGATQKPVALSTFVFQRARLKPGDLVFIPYLGSGPDLAAAVAMGLKVIACDIDEEACRSAVGARLHAVTKPEPFGPLFTERTTT